MAKDFSTMENSNRSGNLSIHEVSDPARRVLLQGGLAATVGAFFAPLAVSGCALPGGRDAAPKLGFKAVPTSRADTIVVPDGYVAQVIAAWGEPVGVPGQMPALSETAEHSAADQAVQLGMHHDGIHFYALEGSRRGLLVMNHEYTDDGLLHPDGMATWSAEKVKKAQAAHGVSVIEVALSEGRWQPVRPSPFARRFTAYTPFALGGPAAGHP